MKDYIPEAIKPGMISPFDSEKIFYLLEKQNKFVVKLNQKT